jgi:hypothetical protein
MANRVFLLGAGFSKPAAFPLANELLHFVQTHLKASMNVRDIDFKKELKTFIDGLDPSLLSNIELLLTYIDLALLNHSVGIFTQCASPEELRLFRKKFSGALVRAFNNAHFKLSGGYPNEELYRIFCDILRAGDTIITFNYDLIVEQELWKQKKWTFIDGYGLEKDVKDFSAPFGGTYSPTHPTESLIKVYKLHGSLGWISDYFKEEIIFIGMPDYFQGYTGLHCESNLQIAGAGGDEGTTLIEPTYIKRFNCTPILDIWKQSIEALRQSNELIIIGYSLPEADAAAYAFLTSGVYNSQLTAVTVVNRDKSVFDKFEMVLGKKVIKKRMTFEEWIKEYATY